jgi:hypothetical protein
MNNDENITIDEKQLESDLENTWKSCCFDLDKRCVQYAVTSFISFTTLGFCMIQLILDSDSNDKAVYFSLIASIVGLHIPSPSLSKK